MTTGSAPARPLRVTHVVTTTAFAGTERYVVDVSNELADRGHAVSVVGGAPSSMTALLRPAVRWAPGGDASRALRSLCAQGRQDIVHSHLTKSDFVAALASVAVGGRRVATRHLLVRRGHTRAAQRMAGPLRSLMHCEIAVSRFVAEQVETAVDVVLLNGVPTAAGVTGPRDRVVLVAQRLEADKDPATALRAFAASGLGAVGWRLQVAGDGSLRTALESSAVELGIAGQTDFLGWVSDLEPLYARAALLLAPPPREPCGLTVLEAMARALPVVAAAAGGHLETVGSVAGAALFPPGDVQSAGRALSRLAEDDALRAAYGQALQRRQRDAFTVEGHVDRLEELYRDVRQSPRSRRAHPP